MYRSPLACCWALGDNHAVAEFASYNFDLRQFWRKTAGDIESVLGEAAPRKEADLPQDRRAPANIAVGRRLCGQARPDWGAATVLVPWYSYLHYGDEDIAKRSWPMMVGWMNFLAKFAVKEGIITEGYGDWCPPDGIGQKRAPVALTSTALYTVLNDYGHAEVTRHLCEFTDYPSLGFLTEVHDLTTWPEVPNDWDKALRYRRNSFNHPMHSGFAVVFHESLGGIRPDPDKPGFKRFLLKPCFLPDLQWAKATHRAPQGLVSSAWKREKGEIVWSVTVPEGTTAQVHLPGFIRSHIQLNQKPATGNTFDLAPGSHVITASR